MTGYGRGVAERGGRRATVEIRSVNHRFLDLKLRGASLDPAIEDQLSGRVRKKVERGALTVGVRLEQREAASSFRVDLAAARHVQAELLRLATELSLPPAIDLALVCAQPGVIVGADPDSDLELLAEVVLEAGDRALAGLLAMRDAEGATLARDLGARIDGLRVSAATIEQIALAAPDEARRRLEDRIGRLLASAKVEVDPNRLAQEVAVIADKLDITEELVRLRSHLDQVGELLVARNAAVGRRLDFLVQELGREINTIAAKSSAAEIARLIVDAKAELEKIREQVQNIE
jgi:uncharacterized protein (TIGR00255 family)